MPPPMSEPQAARREQFLHPVPTGRDLPHDVAAEQALLAALLLDEAAFDQIQALVAAGDFYLLAHQHVYQACQDLARDRVAIDPVRVSQRLEARGLLGREVPRELPFALSRGIGTVANVGHYAEVVKGYSQVRRMMQVAQKLVSLGYDGYKKPWDAFWGQRYAVVHDPDGNAVDLFAPADAG